MTYQLPDYIIYRCYSEECYIWNIKERKAFVFEESAFDVLRILEKNGECSSEKIVDLPPPEGPAKAITVLGVASKETSCKI